MKRPYSAPVCEYMTFTVDNIVAASCAEKPDSRTYTANGTCTMYYAGFSIFNQALTCDFDDTDATSYCYYTVDGQGMLFSS